MSNNTKLLCLFLRAQKINKSSEQGYAMAMVSMVSIIMLSLLAASMTFSNLAKTRTDAFVDSHSAFSVAESGLNKRAVEFKSQIGTYSGVKDVSALTGIKDVKACFGAGISPATPTGTDYLGCRNYSFESSNNVSRVAQSGGISLGGGQDKNTYVAYTSISKNAPQIISIPTGDDYAGLNAAEYKYVLHSTAKKPVDSKGTVSASPTATPAEQVALDKVVKTADDLVLIAAYESRRPAAIATATATARAEESSNSIDLSLTFTNRVIPLFQFGIFYNGDLELNSTSPMQMKGWIHSNANIYLQPAGASGTALNSSITTFLSNVSAVGRIYNRVDAWAPGIGRVGITRVLLTGTSCDVTLATPSNCQDIPAYDAAITDPLTSDQISAFPNKKVQDSTSSSPTIALNTPSPGFTRKRNYFNNKIGIYYSQADMRLEMVPDRDVITRPTAAPWTRNEAIIPFNFTAITTGGSGTCTTTAPTGSSDPAATYVDPNREKLSTLHCNVFTKGQLQSLRQPVLVLTSLNQPDSTLRGISGTESRILGIPQIAGVAALPAIPANLSVAVTGTTPSAATTRKKILRALQVALVSTPSPVPFETLNTAFSQSITPAYISTGTGIYRAFGSFRNGFNGIISGMTELSQADRDNLLLASPNQIAALGDAWFLPAPIQRVERPTQDTNATDSATNLRSSGFYDGREQRWITVLQTNIASLSVWNRDGLYVNADSTDLSTTYNPSATGKNDAFSNANTFDAAHALSPSVVFNSANGTDGLAFDRAITIPTTVTAKGLQTLGLGSIDTTEGGLVFHATVSDNLNGNSIINVLGQTSTINDTNDVTIDTTNPIYKKNADNTDFLDTTLPAATVDKRVIIDYYRKYPGTTPNDTKKSPFAFAFNGGDYLPNALLLSSDQAIYIQGNFNNNGNVQLLTASTDADISRLPASVVADTITALSNECVSTIPGSSNLLSVPFSQLKCGLPSTINSSQASYDRAASPMSINAAFLSNTPVSNGNQGTGRGYVAGDTTNNVYSGGVNNYIRLLEDWNNNNNAYALNYTGSLISLGSPLEYSGLYKAGGGTLTSISYYNVPFRNFNYDSFFSTVEKLPPLTPKASYTQQKNFSRTY
jgi:Tfp pilus assembly protein PilX